MSNPIGWCTHTANPVVGCLGPTGTPGKPAPCPYCYARAMAPRVAAMAAAASGKPVCEACRTFTPHLHPERLEQLRRGRNRRVFVGSMCDLWSKGVEQEWRDQVFTACSCPSNAYLFLTKSPERVTNCDSEWFLAEYEDHGKFWMGITVTCAVDLFDRYQRIPWTGRNTFVSIEPLLEQLYTETLDMILNGHTEWAIIGPGTGKASGRTERAWVEQAASDLRGWGIPVWLKESCFKLWPDMERIQELPEGMPR